MKNLKSKIFLFLILNNKTFCEHNNLIKHMQITFIQYMKLSDYFRPEFINNKEWNLVNRQFEKLRKTLISIKPLIPKIIHQIWLGGELPNKYIPLQQTWLKQHPGWEYKLWTDKEVEEFGLENKILYDATKNFGEKSDIVRYEVLNKFGGLYVDCDFECLQPFDILHYYCDFYAGLGYGTNPIVLCGLFGCTPHHPILKACIKTMKREQNAKENFVEILNRTSVFHFTKCFMANYTEKSVAFPVTFFYPLPDFERDTNAKNILKFIKPESFAIHYWHLSWNNGKLN